MIVVGGLGKTSWVSDGGAEQERHHGSLDCSRGTGSDICSDDGSVGGWVKDNTALLVS